MTDRHIVTKQRMPSTKSVIKRIETALAVEETTRGKVQLEKALDYWKRRRNEAEEQDKER